MKQKIAIKYLRITKIAENIGKTHSVLWNRITVAKERAKKVETRETNIVYTNEMVAKLRVWRLHMQWVDVQTHSSMVAVILAKNETISMRFFRPRASYMSAHKIIQRDSQAHQDSVQNVNVAQAINSARHCTWCIIRSAWRVVFVRRACYGICCLFRCHRQSGTSDRHTEEAMAREKKLSPYHCMTTKYSWNQIAEITHMRYHHIWIYSWLLLAHTCTHKHTHTRIHFQTTNANNIQLWNSL